MSWTYTGFTSSLRFWVLFFLCCVSTLANSAAVCTTLGGYAAPSPSATCAAYVAAQAQGHVMTGATESACNFRFPVAGGQFADGQTQIVCSCAPTVVSNYFATPRNADGSLNLSGIPPSQCSEGCNGLLDLPESRTYSGIPDTYLCLLSNNLAGTETCKFAFRQTGTTCFPPTPPTCTSPQQLNQYNQCETPACPAGQVRETSLGACKPIVCTAPLIKVGNNCEIPKCPTGQTYEYVNGVGQCKANDPVCTPPLTLVNGTCQNPTCPAGMVKDASGTCIRDPVTNPTPTPTPSPNPTPNPNPNPTPTPTPTPEPVAKPPTTGGGGGGGGGGSTNTGKVGLCETPPCGECDPTKETCGNTFGGSCKSGFTCNGDAIYCAIAQATNKAECALQSIFIDTETDPLYKEGEAALNGGTKALGTDGGIPVINGGTLTVNSSNPFAASCPADFHLADYKGTSLDIPLSRYCNIFEIMGSIMLLAASLISIRIITKQD